MKKFLLMFCITFIGLGVATFDAQARRLGGGSSAGMKRDSSVMKRDAAPAQQALPAKQAATPQAATPPKSGMSRWLGPLAGLAAGIGLAALLSHFGMGEGMASMLMILALVIGAVFVFRLLFRRKQPTAQMQYAGAPARFEPVGEMGGGSTAAPPVTATAVNVPADFDVEGFLRQAKVNFIRLQAANDACNLEDIRQFTTPEMFAELRLELGERKSGTQHTDVEQLNAQLLDLATEAKRYVASVRFHGMIREEASAPVAAFDEVWHLTKSVDGSSGWVIAGIQQFE